MEKALEYIFVYVTILERFLRHGSATIVQMPMQMFKMIYGLVYKGSHGVKGIQHTIVLSAFIDCVSSRTVLLGTRNTET